MGVSPKVVSERIGHANTTTGTQTGTTLTLTGTPWRVQRLTADGTHALITTYVYDSATAAYTTQVAEIVGT